ncbi:MAG: LLM class flavin-dependent oxidoreductase [Chloroflexota bacterium]
MSVRIGVGVFGLQAVPQRPTSHARLYRDLIDDARLIESLGFHSIWLSEHHFWFDGYCPSNLAAAGAILGATSRLSVGTGVMLLPMHSARKMADDAATLAHLAPGRLQIGVGLGYRDAEFDGFGIRRRDRGRLMDEKLPELLRIRGQVPRGGPAMYVGAASTTAARRAGRFGLPVLADSTMDAAELNEVMAAYREAAAGAGVQPPASQALQRDCFVSDDPERDWPRLLPDLRYMRRQYAGWGMPLEAGELLPAYLHRLEGDMEAKLRNLIFGRPEEVAQRLRAFAGLGFDTILCRTQFGNIPRDLLHSSLAGLARVGEELAR